VKPEEITQSSGDPSMLPVDPPENTNIARSRHSASGLRSKRSVAGFSGHPLSLGGAVDETACNACGMSRGALEFQA
jgi:hypothetical protein